MWINLEHCPRPQEVSNNFCNSKIIQDEFNIIKECTARHKYLQKITMIPKQLKCCRIYLFSEKMLGISIMILTIIWSIMIDGMYE